VSRFGRKLAGAGGFINITQNSRIVVFVGTFTAGGLQVAVKDGTLVIEREGKAKKFVKRVEQVTFSGRYAAAKGQRVLYVTERCVFRLGARGLELIEVAPGIDVGRDILAQMEFEPIGRKVAAVVNYDHFQIDESVMDAYAAMVQDLSDRYYTHVSRYTTSAFMRLKLGEALEHRGVAPHIFETQREALDAARPWVGRLPSSPGS